jgi:predicted RNA-binding Zn-ribbon protein involved in translation (DUF1610 family)
VFSGGRSAMTEEEIIELREFTKSLDARWDKKVSDNSDLTLLRSDWEHSMMMSMKKSINNIKKGSVTVILYDGRKRKTFQSFQKCKNAMCKAHMQLHEVDVYLRMARYVCPQCGNDIQLTDKELRVTISPSYEERNNPMSEAETDN